MIKLENTNGNEVAAAIARERHRMGSPTTGMVLTLLVVTEEEHANDAIEAASGAAREHPMRILVLIPRKARGKGHIDAHISVGGDEGPGELAVLRIYGEVAKHIGSVAIPLLLSDTPVVAWWAGDAPDVPSQDEIGMHSQRRITDATFASRELKEIEKRAAGYTPGDTDLAWAQLTGWRTILASLFDEPFDTVESVEITVPAQSAAGGLLASWLHCRLGVPVTVRTSRGPGITEAVISTKSGDMAIRRPDGERAMLSRPNRPDTVVALPRRSRAELLAEELRRLDPDVIYGEALESLAGVTFTSAKKPGRKAAK